jgi:leader peptidase (prepilin peptidase)/N-methyltransferase
MDLLELLGTLDPHAIAVGFWLAMAFILGASIGSFVNVAVARLPVEKSLLWPGSRCSRCQQPVRWFDNLPLISYLLLRGRCRSCGGSFSSRYFWIELLTGLGFAGLLFAEVVLNVHGWPGVFLAMPPLPWLLGFSFHALLFSMLMIASVCDLRSREIPLSLTLTGTALGLVGAVFLPWPWPHAVPGIVMPRGLGVVQPAPVFFHHSAEIKEGIFPWPFWGPLPEPFAPGSNWQTGLADGIAGALAGTFLMRAVGFLFGTGLGKEAMGLGDADLMMMAGAFLGWQVVLVAFLLSVVPALLFGIIQLAIRRDNALAFGPSLSVGVMAACLGWHWLNQANQLQQIMFNGLWMVSMVGVSAGMLLGMSFLMRLVRG